MKLLYFFLFLTCQSSVRLNELKAIDSRITDMVISPVFENVKSDSDSDNDVFVLNINRKKEKSEVRISMVDKKDFRWYLIDKKDKIFGFTKYKDFLVIVFGNAVGEFYDLTQHNEIFAFLEPLKKNTKVLTKDEIAEPPISFEPMVWVYCFDNIDGFNLKQADMALPILDADHD